LATALDGREWSDSCSGRFTPRERSPGTHWIGGWVRKKAPHIMWTYFMLHRQTLPSRNMSEERQAVFQAGIRVVNDVKTVH